MKSLIRSSLSVWQVLVLVVVVALLAGATGAIAAATIGSGQIIDNSIRSRDVRTATLTASDLADSSVSSSELKNGAVTSSKMGAAYGTIVVGGSSIGSASDIPVLYDNELMDTAGMWSNGQPGTLSVATAGTYLITARLEWEGNAGGTFRKTCFSLNGTSGGCDLATDDAFDGVNLTQQNTAVYQLAAGDTIEYWASQDSGGALNGTSTLSIIRLGA